MITTKDLEDVGKCFKQSPVGFVKKMINKKFTLTILIHIWFLKQHRFGELITIKTMNSKTLTLTLRDMTKNELIRKKNLSKKPQDNQIFYNKKRKSIASSLHAYNQFCNGEL